MTRLVGQTASAASVVSVASSVVTVSPSVAAGSLEVSSSLPHAAATVPSATTSASAFFVVGVMWVLPLRSWVGVRGGDVVLASVPGSRVTGLGFVPAPQRPVRQPTDEAVDRDAEK